MPLRTQLMWLFVPENLRCRPLWVQQTGLVEFSYCDYRIWLVYVCLSAHMYVCVCVCDNHHNQILDILITPEISRVSILIPVPIPSSKLPLIFFCLWICLFWTCHIKHVIEYLIFSFCLWFHVKILSIHVYCTYTSASFIFYGE